MISLKRNTFGLLLWHIALFFLFRNWNL